VSVLVVNQSIGNGSNGLLAEVRILTDIGV